MNQRAVTGQSKEKEIMRTEVNLKIADVIIQMQSEFALEQISEEGLRIRSPERFNNFFYNGTDKPEITIEINIVDKMPETEDAEDIFVTYHFQNGAENWRLLKKGNGYIYKCPAKNKQQVMFINEPFDRVSAYLLPKENKGRVWNFTDIIYDFLQVLLINYFALKKEGIFVHSIGVKDLNGEGFLFAGKSGAGKSTTARLWHRYSGAMVLNDDRIIVRRSDGKFFIHGSPWHGEFNDYLQSRIDSALLEKLFFIYHSSCNTAARVSAKEAFSQLYPALFPTFWDKACLENIAFFCQDLIRGVSCYNLGFVDDEKIIEFIRKLEF